MFLIALLIVGGIAFYVMTPHERTRLLQRAVATLHQGASAAAPRAEEQAFRAALRARTPMAIVTLALVALNVLMFLRLLFAAGSMNDPNTLIAAGGNFAPRTTNGEWGRVVTSMFMPAGFVDLVVSMIGLAVVGLVVERLVGPATFAVTYLAAGIVAGIADLFAYPLIPSSSATAAILGVYGLAIATSAWSLLRRSPLTMPLAVVKRLGPAVGIFAFYILVTGRLGNVGNIAGLAVGLAIGLALTRDVGENVPSIPRAGAAMAATLAIALVCSVPLRGIADVGPSIAQVVAAEDRTAGAYQKAVSQFVKGRAAAGELATLIDGTIVPDLQQAAASLHSLSKVAREQQQLVADATEYERLRLESWSLRAEGLREGNMRTLREADKTERAALTALERVRPLDQR
jgi:rhomboid protease GluP